MHIGAYGWAKKDGGSHESSSYLLLQQLVQYGHSVVQIVADDDPAAVDGVRHPAHTIRVAGLAARSPWLDRLLGPTSGVRSHLYDRAVRQQRHWALVQEQLARDHAEHPFDVTLNMGTDETVRLPRTPHVAWPQGPPRVEAEGFIQALPNNAAWMRPARLGVLTAYNTYRLRARPQEQAADIVISQSDWGARRWRAWHHDVVTVPYCLDLELAVGVSTAPKRSDGARLLFLGRMDPRKQVSLLLEAFEVVRRERPEATLTLVGSAGYAPEIVRRISRAGVTYLTPVPRPQVWSLLAAHDVLVQPSNGETLGTAAIEAQSVGLTCVVGADSGTAEYICSNSRVFSDYKAIAVADALLSAISVRDKDPVGAVAAARSAASQFSPERVGRQLESVLMRASARKYSGEQRQ